MLKVYKSFSAPAKVFLLALLGVAAYSAIKIGVTFYDENSTHNATYGGMYTEGSVGAVRAINPVIPYATDSERDLAHLVFAGLQRLDTTTGQMVAELADCQTANAKVYTCILKDNLMWQDGQPLTMEDVLFTYNEVVKNPSFVSNPALKATFANVAIAAKEDNKTIEFTLPEADSGFITELSLGLLPKHLLGMLPIENLELSEFNLAPVGAGAYSLESLTKDKDVYNVRLKRNDYYVGAKPYIDTVVLYFYPNFTDLMANLNLFNAVKGVPADQVKKFENNERFNLYTYTLPQYVAAFLNTEKGVQGDAKVRYGLLLATDKATLAGMANGKKVDTPYLDDQSDFDIEYNPERAKGAFYDAGYKMGDDGKRYKKETIDGQEKVTPLKLKMITSGSTAVYENIAQTIKAEWESLGVAVDLQVLTDADFNKAIIARDYDVMIFGQNFGYNPDLSPFWHSKNAGTGLNFSNYRNYTLDVLLDSARSDTNAKTRADNYKKVAKFVAGPIYDEKNNLVNGVAAIFLYTPDFYLSADNKIKGVSLENMAYSADRFWNLDSWYIREQKALQSSTGIGTIFSWFWNKL